MTDKKQQVKRNTLLAIFSGLLLWLAWPPVHYTTFLLFFGMVPMLVAIENIIQSDESRKGKKIFRTAFIGFFIWNTLCVYWVYNSLKQVGEVVALPISMIPYSLGPLLMATAFSLYYRVRQHTSRNISLLLLAGLWIGYEYLHQTWDLKFPWMTLGNGFAVSHSWVQWYEYTGVYGGTVWIWASNIFIFLIYIGLREAKPAALRLKQIAIWVAIIILPLSFSLYRYYTYVENADPANIVAVQPNIDPYAKISSIPAMEQVNSLIGLSDSIGQANTEYFIWPETAIYDESAINEDKIRHNAYYLRVQNFLNKYKNGNVLTGIESTKLYNSDLTPSATHIPGSDQYYDVFNAAMNVENSSTVQFYHKSKLVPGVEALPFSGLTGFLKPVFEHLGGAVGSYGSQKEPTVFYSQSGMGAAPIICFDSIFGEWVAKSVGKGAQFVAIITNDGWWENTSGKDQHLDYAKLRAIETRRWVCRSANTGISAFINQRGDIVQQSKWWVKTALKQNINLNSDITFYVRFGDYIPMFGSLITVLCILFLLFKRFSNRKLEVSKA